MKIKKSNNKKILIGIMILVMSISITGCSFIRDKIALTKGELLGNHFNIAVFDHQGSKTLSMEGKKVTISNMVEDLDDETGEKDSSVLEITINGEQLIQVGNTMIFAEKGLEKVADFEIPEEMKISKGGSFVPIDRYVNDLKNKIGKEKTIMISTPKGVPIAVYEGKRVYVTVPKDLPKMTRLNIDGKSLYVHRANYLIMDTNILN